MLLYVVYLSALMAVVSCPSNSAGAPICSCNSGYSGSLSFVGSSWTGTCSCKLFIEFISQTVVCNDLLFSGCLPDIFCWGSALCMQFGLQRHSIFQFRHSSLAGILLSFVLDGFTLTTVVACPTNAAGGPACTCSSGYSGTPTFSTGTQTWSGTCSREFM